MAKNNLAPPSQNALVNLLDPINLYRQNISAPKRAYGESLLKSFTGRTEIPMTERDFTPTELTTLSRLVNENYQQKLAYFSRPKTELLAEANQLEQNAQAIAALEKQDPTIKSELSLSSTGLLNQAKLLKNAAAGKLPDDFAFKHEDYVLPQTTAKDESWRDWKNTLGRFRYKIDRDTNTFKIYDTYDFSNEARKGNVDKYAAMSPVQRFKSAVQDFMAGNQGSFGEAYLSADKGVPVNINVSAQP